jgi:hypothetical protein
VRLTLRSNLERGIDWSITSYYSNVERRHQLSLNISRTSSVCNGRRDLFIGKLREDVLATGYELPDGYVVKKFPSHFTDPHMFWVDFGRNWGTDGHAVSGMYPYDWPHITRMVGLSSLYALLAATKRRDWLTVGNVRVPLFWYPYPHAREGAETLLHHMYVNNIPMEVNNDEHF